MNDADENRLRRTFPLSYMELDQQPKKLNGTAEPLNILLKKHGLPELIEEYDHPRNRELHMNKLETKLAKDEANAKNWLDAQAEYGKQ